MNFYFKLCCDRFVQTKNCLWKMEVFLFPVVFVVLAVLLKYKSYYWYKRLFWQEDSLIENLTAIFYFFSFLISFSISKSFFKNKSKLFGLLYLLLSLSFIFIMMEEISWGQRIFGIDTIEIFRKHNYQNEITLHNIRGVPLHSLYILAGLYGALIRFIIPKNIKRRHGSIVDLFVPDYYLIFYFIIVAVLYLYYDYFSSTLVALFGDQFGWGEGNFMHGKDQEPAEFLLSVGFLLFVLINKCRQRDKGANPVLSSRFIEKI